MATMHAGAAAISKYSQSAYLSDGLEVRLAAAATLALWEHPMLTKLFARPRAKTAPKNILLTQPWTNVTLPQEVLDVPTMLTVRERQVLHWLARHHANGSGRIVDGGCFLGGSTAALASGLAARGDGRWKKAIASYDLFRVEPYTLLEYREHFANPTVDASFRPDFDANIAPWSEYVDVREGNAVERG